MSEDPAPIQKVTRNTRRLSQLASSRSLPHSANINLLGSKKADETLAVSCVGRTMAPNSLPWILFLPRTAPSPLHPISPNSMSSGSPGITSLIIRNPTPKPPPCLLATLLIPGMLPQRRLSENRRGLYRPGNRRVRLRRLFLRLTALNWVSAMPQVRPGGQKGDSFLPLSNS